MPTYFTEDTRKESQKAQSSYAMFFKMRHRLYAQDKYNENLLSIRKKLNTAIAEAHEDKSSEAKIIADGLNYLVDNLTADVDMCTEKFKTASFKETLKSFFPELFNSSYHASLVNDYISAFEVFMKNTVSIGNRFITNSML